MAIKKDKRKTKMARNPYYAFMHLELAKKFGLSKEKMRSELERLVSAIGSMDFVKGLETDNGSLDEFLEDRDYAKIFDKAKDVGVKKELISKAAYQVARGYLRTEEGILFKDTAINGLKTIQKSYSVRPSDMQNAILEYYHEGFE